jgi:hypothetical protein
MKVQYGQKHIWGKQKPFWMNNMFVSRILFILQHTYEKWKYNMGDLAYFGGSQLLSHSTLFKGYHIWTSIMSLL